MRLHDLVGMRAAGERGDSALVRSGSDRAVIEAAFDDRLDAVEADWDRRSALGVVVAAAGYPDAPRKGDVISGLPAKLLLHTTGSNGEL